MPMPRLWSWSLSPFAGKVRVAFAEKDVAINLLEIDPRERPARLRALNPTNRVPVLEVGEVAIRESSAICDWLEDAHPEPSLWPSDPATRGGTRATAIRRRRVDR
jgi:glutathione S-transferase